MSQIFSDKIDLADVFSRIDYIAILRMSPDFPNYKAGSDIDILCNSDGYTIEDLSQLFPLTTIKKGPGHIQLDYIVDGKLDLKFDLYTQIISQMFTHDLLLTSRTIGRRGKTYYVPSLVFDGMLKCHEYLKFPKRKQRYREFLKFKPQLDEYM